MKRYDWHALEPARPLASADARYVPRPWGGGDRLAVLVRNGLTPIVVTGPLGSGKTTELRHAAGLLGDDTAGFAIEVEKLLPPEDLRPELLLWEIAHHLIDTIVERDPEARPSRALVEDIRASDPRLPRGSGIARTPTEIARMVLAEVRLLTGRSRVALLVDGIDQADHDRATAAIRALLSLRHDADLVIVVAPALAHGPDSHEVLAHVRVWWLPAIPVASEAGRKHLARIVARRLDHKTLPKALHEVVDRAAVQSGGVTRLFLHLVQDAALYASAEGRVRPNAETLTHAIRDHADALRRVLVAGDLDALAKASDTDGLEVPADRKVRLLAHNALLEYPEGELSVVRPHPLLHALIANRR